jgi:flagellar biosynthetic protein FliO
MDKLTLIKKWLDAGGSRRKWTVALFTVSILVTAILFIATGSAPEYGALEPTPLYFVGIIAKLIAVLLFIIGGAIFLRRWQVKSGLGRSGQLRVVESVRLSPKQAIHLVKVGNQHVLIGATDQTISVLTSVNLPEAEVPTAAQALPAQTQSQTDLNQTSFFQLLQSLTTNQQASSPAGDEIKE